MELRVIDGAGLAELVSMRAAIDALEAAFARPLPHFPDRQHLDVDGGDLLLMPAWSRQGAGVKLVTVSESNPERGLPLIHGIYVLFDKPSLRPVALFDAAPLTALRTAAVSAVATRHLARPDGSRLVIFGAGVQASSHLVAMHEVLDLSSVRVVSRTPERARALADDAMSLGLEAAVGSVEDVATADIICTCTTSSAPLFDGDLLKPGAHVNAVGSYRPDARELDDSALRRARVVVDTETALRESGDLITPLRNAVLDTDDVQLLADVVERGSERAQQEITIFKSVGAAFQDLAVAEAAAARL